MTQLNKFRDRWWTLIESFFLYMLDLYKYSRGLRFIYICLIDVLTIIYINISLNCTCLIYIFVDRAWWWWSVLDTIWTSTCKLVEVLFSPVAVLFTSYTFFLPWPPHSTLVPLHQSKNKTSGNELLLLFQIVDYFDKSRYI